MRVLVTRPLADGRETGDKLAALGLEPVFAPLIDFEPLDAFELPAGPFSGLVVTSANAIRALELGGATEGLVHLPVFAVGEKTATAARRAGFATVTSAKGDADELVELIKRAGEPKSRLLYIRGREVSHNLGEALAPLGFDLADVPIYHMRAATALPKDIAHDLDQGRIEMAVFYSRRTAEIFSALSGGAKGAKMWSSLRLLCLSNNVAQPFVGAGLVRIGVADHPSEEAMLALALSEMRAHS